MTSPSTQDEVNEACIIASEVLRGARGNSVVFVIERTLEKWFNRVVRQKAEDTDRGLEFNAGGCAALTELLQSLVGVQHVGEYLRQRCEEDARLQAKMVAEQDARSAERAAEQMEASGIPEHDTEAY